MSRNARKETASEPKRPLSSYNLFFLLERKHILKGSDSTKIPVTPEDIEAVAIENEFKPRRPHRKSHGKISFQDLARTIAARWKNLDPSRKSVFDDQAKVLRDRYERNLQQYLRNCSCSETRARLVKSRNVETSGNQSSMLRDKSRDRSEERKSQQELASLVNDVASSLNERIRSKE